MPVQRKKKIYSSVRLASYNSVAKFKMFGVGGGQAFLNVLNSFLNVLIQKSVLYICVLLSHV